ncbi:MAG: hypothetical protein AAF693_09405 [Bacteroidota bacterium]
MKEFSEEELVSLKRSFMNILAMFFKNKAIETKYVACLMKWSTQMELSIHDLHKIEENFDHLDYKPLETKEEKLEAIFHLVHMIYLDNIVEDIELEVATMYADKLGFGKEVVDELFKAIATAPSDGKTNLAAREEIAEFLALYK